MPRIPDSTALGQRPDIRIPTAVANPVSQAVPEALGNASRILEQAGDTLQQRQDEQVLFGARRQLNDWESSNLYDPTTGLVSKKGADALAMPQQISQSFDDTATQILSGLHGKQIQQFQDMALNRKAQAMDWTNRYVNGERQNYNTDQYKADIESSANRAAQSGDPNVVATELGLQKFRTQNYMSSIGAPQSQIDEAVRNAQGSTVSGTIEGLLADGNYKSAQSYLDGYKDTLNPQQQYILGNKIDEFAAPDLGQSIYSKHGGDLHSALNEAHQIQKSSLRTSVQSWIRQQYSFDQADSRQNYALLSDSATQGIAALQSGVTLTPQVNSQIDDTIQSLRRQGGKLGIASGRLADRLSTARDASQLVVQMSALPLSEQAPFVQSELAKLPQATNIEDAGNAAYTSEFLKSAYVRTQQAIRSDPYGAYVQQTGQQVQPLDFSQPLAPQLAARTGVASKITARWGVNPGLLTPQESSTLSASMEQQPWRQQADTLAQIKQSAPNQAAYQRTVQQIRPDSPVTQLAGAINGTDGSLTYGSGLFSRGTTLNAPDVASTLLLGESLLNPTKADKATDGKAKFTMPADTLLRTEWANTVGDAYRGFPDVEESAYQGYKAYYAGKASQNGNFTGVIDSSVAKEAAAAASGGVDTINGKNVILPWGMTHDDFRAKLAAAGQAAGLPHSPTAYQLDTIGNGVYAVVQGTGPVIKDGKMVILNLNNTPPVKP